MSVPTVVITADRSALEVSADKFTADVNAVLFPRLGVLTPSIQAVIKRDEMAPARLSFNGAELGTIDLLRPAESTADLLASRAPDLVVSPLVEFFLSRLELRFPALVGAIKRQFSTDTIVNALRLQLARGESIRHLPGALEQILASAVTTEARDNFPASDTAPPSRSTISSS